MLSINNEKIKHHYFFRGTFFSYILLLTNSRSCSGVNGFCKKSLASVVSIFFLESGFIEKRPVLSVPGITVSMRIKPKSSPLSSSKNSNALRLLSAVTTSKSSFSKQFFT